MPNRRRNFSKISAGRDSPAETAMRTEEKSRFSPRVGFFEERGVESGHGEKYGGAM